MSVPERRAMVERPGENLSVRRQCALLNLARSGDYRPGPVTGADDLALMRRIDELHLKWPGRRRLWICRFAWTTQTRCPHTHSRRKSSSRKLLDLKDKAGAITP